MKRLPAILSLLLLPAITQGQDDEHAHHVSKSDSRALGHVTFPNSGNAAAQKPFLEGLALIHSFEYTEAVNAFKRSQQADPAFALPYWMEALSSTQLVWGIDDTATAHAVLKRLAPSPSERLRRARTARERAFGAAVEAFYADGTEEQRARAFADSLRHWTQKQPTDPEAHAFAALGIIWQALYVDGEAAAKLRTEAAQNAEYVFDRNPLHPGAAHYIIHATDAPATARRGLKAALEYSRIAPDAEHALHMPSHIFLPLGMWDELASANERAWKASRAGAARNKLEPWASDWHSLNWLQYAYLQQGRWKAARALIDTARLLTGDLKEKVKPADDPDAALAVEQLAFRYGVETGDWSQFPADPVLIDVSDQSISARARGMATISRYQHGLVALKGRNDSAGARAAIASLASGPPRFTAVLQNLLADSSERIAALRKIWTMTRVDRYSSMTPANSINIADELGGALIAAGQANEAVTIYREALSDRPRVASLLLGLARAQEAAGDKAGAGATYAELQKVWAHADPDVRAMLR